MHRNNIQIYIQKDATLCSLFYLETALHVSGGAITHHEERKQLYLQHLVFVTPLLLPAAIAVGTSILYYFQLCTAAFKAYCAILVRRSNFRHQASPRVSPRESTQRRNCG